MYFIPYQERVGSLGVECSGDVWCTICTTFEETGLTASCTLAGVKSLGFIIGGSRTTFGSPWSTGLHVLDTFIAVHVADVTFTLDSCLSDEGLLGKPPLTTVFALGACKWCCCNLL